MKLTNKVTNVFFAAIAIISLFMPIVGYSTLLTGESYNVVDLFKFLGEMNTSQTNLLDSLGDYGYRGLAIAVAVFFALMLLCLLVTTVFGFMNVPYLARTIASGLGFGSYVTAVVCFLKICNAFMSGRIPTSAITSLGGEGDILGSLISSFVSISKMGIAAGAFVGMVSLGVLFIFNLVFFLLRNRIARADGESDTPKKREKRKTRKAKKEKN